MPEQGKKVRNEKKVLKLNVPAHHASLIEVRKKYNLHEFIMQFEIIVFKLKRKKLVGSMKI